MAPDIDTDLFKELQVSMKRSAKSMTLYASSRDAALRGSEYLAGNPRAGVFDGKKGESPVILPGLTRLNHNRCFGCPDECVGRLPPLLWGQFDHSERFVLSDPGLPSREAFPACVHCYEIWEILVDFTGGALR